MVIISILIDIVLNPFLIVKFLFFCYDKFMFRRRANEIGTAFGASEKSESGKERAGRNSPQTPLPPRPKNKIGVAKRFRRLGIKTSKQNNFQFLLRKIWRAGVKKLKENCFALLAEVRRAETRSEAIQAFFVQKRFELRSVIATRLNFF